MKINEYGTKLQNDFTKEKTTIYSDVETGVFQGMIFYEYTIKTVADVVGWMLESYGNDALQFINDWIELGHAEAWDLDICEVKQELEKCFDNN